jgi:uncharacterized protein
VTALRQRLRDALPAAMKARDRVAVAALRSALAAIDNAEAVGGTGAKGMAIEQSPVGVGAAELPRRELTAEQVEEIVRAEVAEREAAALGYERGGHADRAAQLRNEIRVLAQALGDIE